MNKKELQDRLRWFADNGGVGLADEYGHPDYRTSRDETILAGMLGHWLSESDFPADGSISQYLPDLVVEAYADFSSSPTWETARLLYRIRTGASIPDLVDVHAGGIRRALVVHSLCRLLPLLTGDEWLRGKMETTLGAQMEVIDHAWRRFVRVAYRGLMPRIKAEAHRGNVGVFGKTTLSTFACAGRVEFSFSRGTGTMTYVADDSDAYGHRSGPNTPDAPYAECVAMIEDVVAHWDADGLRRDRTTP